MSSDNRQSYNCLLRIFFGFFAVANSYAESEKVPLPSEISSFHCQICASSHFKSWKMDQKQLEEVLSTYFVVSEQIWRNNYSHVGLNDQNGTIKLKDNTEVQWLARPGGLAILTFPNGKKIYLAKEKS